MLKISKIKTTKRFFVLLFCITTLTMGVFFVAKHMGAIDTSAITADGTPVSISYEREGTDTDGWVHFRYKWGSPMFLVQPDPDNNTIKYTAFCLDPGISAPEEGDGRGDYKYRAKAKETTSVNDQIKLAIYMATAPSNNTAVSNKLNEWFSLEKIDDQWKTDNGQGLNVTDGAYGMRNYRYIMFHALIGYINNINKPDGNSKKNIMLDVWGNLASLEQNWITEKMGELEEMIETDDPIWQEAESYRLYGLDMSEFEANGVSIQDVAWIEPISYSINTYAKDDKDGDEYLEASKNAKVVDSVNYCGEPNTNYTISGKIMEKTGVNTGKPLTIDGKEVTASVSTSTEAPDGCGEVAVVFEFDATKLAGKELVVFESLYSGSDLLAEHDDWNDSLQTINVVFLDTDASDKSDDDKKVLATKDAVVRDNIKYYLPAGTYTIFGVLMNKETGEAIVVDGKEISNFTEITTTGGYGELDMEFAFDATGLGGTEIVVFETAAIKIARSCTDADLAEANCIVKEKANGDEESYHVVVSHHDLDDAAQTILVTKLAAPETGLVSSEKGSSESASRVLMAIVIATPILGISFYLTTRFVSRKSFFKKRY